MHLDPDQTVLLRRVVKARERCEKAEREGREAALRAAAAGVPQSRVAEAFGVSRMWLWRLQQQADAQQSRTREAA